MRTATIRPAAAASAAALVLALLAALAPAPAGATGSISGSAVVDGATATATGTASIPAPDGPIPVGGAITGFAGANTPAGPAISLTGAQVELRPDGVAFTWRLADVPDTIPPEGVRYTWAFAAGGQTYQLQVKSSNVAGITTTEDPVGHAEQAASRTTWFQLRGACEDAYRGLAVSGCYHLGFFQGTVDPVGNTITMVLPFGARDRIGRVVAESFTRGTEITPVETAGASIAGSYQAVVSNNTTSSFINGWKPVFTGPTVQLGVGRPGLANPMTATWSGVADYDEATGAFSGTVSGLTATNSAVYARICHGLRDSCVAVELPRA